MTIKITVADKRASVIGTPIIVCGNSDYSIEFEFDAEWSNVTIKNARFVYVHAGIMKYQDVVFSGNTVQAPVLTNIREVLVGVYAGDLRTTTPAKINCKRSILCGSGTHADPEPDVYNQLLDLINSGLVTDEWIKSSVYAWLNEHPEATTTVQDGSITEAKLHDRLAREHHASLIVCESSGEIVQVGDSSDCMLHGLSIYGKTTQAGTPTPENPVELVSAGASGAINTTVRGTKNLFGGEALADRIVSFGGQKGEDSMGRFVTIESEKIAEKTIFDDFDENKWYYIALYGQNTNGMRATNIVVSYESGRVRSPYFPADLTVGHSDTNITDKSFGSFKLEGRNNGGTTKLYYDKCGIFEWWTPGFVFENEFEPYKGQTLTASTPNGLRGIPVTSGGNHTDESGQQWICDEIDFARGVYVQRIGSADMGALTWEHRVSGERQIFYTRSITKIALCKYGNIPINAKCKLYRAVTRDSAWKHGDMAYFAADSTRIDVVNNNYTDATAFKNAMTGVDIIYELATHKETPLSAEELAQYAALHTNKPNTTVYNDAGAGLAVEYVADTKNYIDQKLAAISAALLNA